MVLAGALAGFFASPRLALSPALMLLAIVATFLARDPLGMLLRRPKVGAAAQAASKKSLQIFAPLGLAASLGVLTLHGVEGRPLLPLFVLGLSGGLLFTALVVARTIKQERSLWAEGLGLLSLALPPLAMQLACRGELVLESAQLALACTLFFAGASLHLRGLLRLRKAKAPDPGDLQAQRRRARGPWLWSLASVLSVLVFFGLALLNLLPQSYALASCVALLRPFVMRGWTLGDPRRVGFSEAGLVVSFLPLTLVTS